MTETRNLGLKKYEATDRYDLMASYNDSMDIIDAAFGDVESMIDTVNEAQLGSLQTNIRAKSTTNLDVILDLQPDALATITLTALESISSEVLAGLKLVNYDTGERFSFDADRNASYTCVIPPNGSKTIILYNSSNEDFVTTPDEDFVCTVSYPVKLDEQQSKFISKKVFSDNFWQYFGVNGIFVYTESEYAALENKDDHTLYIVIPDEEVSS